MTDHNRIIAAAAKEALRPLGLRRKGRSRAWFADEGFWLNVVEFQPSSWSRGSYLNVAVHWLWSQPPGLLSFNRVERSGGFIEFENSEQFEPLALRMAQAAADGVLINRRLLGSITDAAAILLQEQGAEVPPSGRPRFDAAIAAGLTDKMATARDLLQRFDEPHAVDMVSELISSIDQGRFHQRVETMINAGRSQFGLAPNWCL